MPIRRTLAAACLTLLVQTVLVGFVYPMAVTAISQALWPDSANGHRVYRSGRLIGSSLIGQPFSSPWYFHPRPSAAGPTGYDATASGGTNYGPTRRLHIETLRVRLEAARHENPGVPVPIDLVTASGSGLDPHISPDAARFQVPRVARERGVSASQVVALIDLATTGRDWGVLGEPRVNVLLLNLALDSRWPISRPQSSPQVNR